MGRRTGVLILTLVLVGGGFKYLWDTTNYYATGTYGLGGFFIALLAGLLTGALLFLGAAFWLAVRANDLEKKVRARDQTLIEKEKQQKELIQDQRILRALLLGQEAICVIDRSDGLYGFSDPYNLGAGPINFRYDRISDRSVYFIPPGTGFWISMEDDDDNELASQEFSLALGETLVIGYKGWLPRNLPFGAEEKDIQYVGKSGMAYLIYRSPLVKDRVGPQGY